MHAAKTGLLNVAVEVHIKQLEDNDKVPPEVEAVKHFDDVMLVRVLSQNALQ